jgi:hypothetical protein
MRINKVFLPVLAMCVLFPLTTFANNISAQIERAVFKSVSEQTPVKYYVPLIQLDEKEAVPGADGAEAGIFWVEIGGTNTADGYEPEFFYLHTKKVEPATKDGPSAPAFEEIVPSVFNEAYRRFAADPRSAKATIDQTRQLLNMYYRQVQADQQAKAQKPAN